MIAEIDYNGTKVTITLTDEQIKEIEKQTSKFEWKFFPGCHIMDFNSNKVYNNTIIEQECIENGTLRLQHGNARLSLDRNKRANRLEALVEQLGYDLKPWGSAGVLYYIYQNYSGKYQIDRTNGELQPEVVYMTEECAFEICQLINDHKFSLEGDS